MGFRLGLQMMIGLPGDTLEKSVDTANRIVSLGAEDVRIYPLLVIKDTSLETLYLQHKYEPLAIEMAVSWCKEIYLVFEKGGVNILRVGLHPSEGLMNGTSLVAGPFHISFRELVMTEIWKEQFSRIEKKRTKKYYSLSFTFRNKLFHWI